MEEDPAKLANMDPDANEQKEKQKNLGSSTGWCRIIREGVCSSQRSPGAGRGAASALFGVVGG